MSAIMGLQAIRGVEKGILIIQSNSLKNRGELLRYDYFLFSNNSCL
jgi:hypothetical protein